MGEKQNQPFQLSFNSSLKVDFQGYRVTSDGGLMPVRELDERLGFGDPTAQHLTDSRRGRIPGSCCRTYCASPSTAGSPAMKMPTMPSGTPRIRPSG